ncbi:UpxY family transcription antiterminator [Zhouia spongiae]|uniref:UpxY family transcription antiterminator n=1 Tax=Zhouia spongiae TaxID=2202721 RepID=A0ABY3YL48_9FLAO|nr:UpxY family transcription antiterminator [Zhouia spongiae]UNY98319.1 UpxY family transcription antiterminator [Zhouia spongiae]
MSDQKSGKWHVIYVKSRYEKKVHKYLKEKNLISFLPVTKSIRKWSDRKKVVFKPLFPSYVFVYINTSLDFHKALSVKGACCYIRFGKEYAIVSDKEINQIKILVEDDNISDISTNNHNLKVGDTRQIESGPLSGLECEILKVGNSNSIKVKLDSLQQSIIASVPSCYFNCSIES